MKNHNLIPAVTVQTNIYHICKQTGLIMTRFHRGGKGVIWKTIALVHIFGKIWINVSKHNQYHSAKQVSVPYFTDVVLDHLILGTMRNVGWSHFPHIIFPLNISFLTCSKNGNRNKPNDVYLILLSEGCSHCLVFKFFEALSKPEIWKTFIPGYVTKCWIICIHGLFSVCRLRL